MAFAQKLVIVMALAIVGAMYQDVWAEDTTVPTTTAATTPAANPTTTAAGATTTTAAATTTAAGATTTTASTTTAAPSLCAASQPSSPWDKCTAAGTFKSVSSCYYNANTASYVYRYDFFKCVRSSLIGGFFFYRQNCTGPTPIVNGEPFNRFNPSSKKCDLPVPAAQ